MSPSILSLSLLSLSLVTSTLATPLSTNYHNDGRRASPFVLAPILTPEHEAPHGLVNNSYIVMLKKDLPLAALDNHYNFLQAAHAEDPLLHDESGIRHVFNSHIKGYAGKFTDNVLQRIREMPEVDYVERDQIVRTQETQKSAPWGLARISHRPRLTFGTFTKYEYDSHGGEGVDVYVIDTGINIHHKEFQGRASWGKTIPANDVDEDNNGHGTHCAGTIASRRYGVAKSANVIAVKVLGSNGSGSMSDVVSGVVFAAEAAAAKAELAAAELKATGKTKHKGSVANMSLGGGKSRALDDAVNGAVDTGLHFAVAAGNDNRDACSYSPAAAEKAVTVGASTLGDERAYFSNYGPCVDVFAPGLNILSTWIGSETAFNTISGTSMASPHTAGVLAYLLSIYPSATFDPSSSSLVPPELNTQRPFTGSFTRLYESTYNIMPRWVSGFLPPPQLVQAVVQSPIEVKPLSPAGLKAALVGLSSKGLLSEIPKDTVNLLVFNNFTSVY
ncbi:peptidase S8/S53 domain-containing protein [Multifurca ochricompacta]|uniref:Peptidase S8/S53 domain-containing protein n=1 Tax=Multifurca ochricompacta TaxID=376703 RepID=A0AAD4M7A1_9AGAM|nr:peptidase S8/S53 domain-containing protein [Multifurca ochricompacta]